MWSLRCAGVRLVRDTNDHSPLVTSVLPYAPARVGLGARGALEVPENTGPGAALAVLIARDGDLGTAMNPDVVLLFACCPHTSN